MGKRDKIIEPPSDNTNVPVVYYALNEDVKIISNTENLSEQLSDKLIIHKGKYNFHNQTYDLKEEGLYRFSFPPKDNQQRIVYEKNLDSLLSSVCWISAHGTDDDEKNYDEINKKAINSKIFLTCGPTINWTMELLKQQSIKARIVSSLTLEEWNSYDNGHIMIEIFHPDLQKWIVYDIDNNCYFKTNNKSLSFLEFYSSIQSDEYKIHYLAPQSNMAISKFIDRKSNYDFNFILELKLATEKLRRRWYKKIVQVPLILDEKFSYFFDQKNRDKIEKYSSYYKFLKYDDFIKKFY